MKKIKLNVLNIVNIVANLAMIILGAVLLAQLKDYVQISTKVIGLGMVVFVALLVLVVVYNVYIILYHQKPILSIIGIVISLVISGFLGYGVSYVGKINKVVDEIVVDDTPTYETYKGVFVTYKNKKFDSVDDFTNDTRFGYIDNEEFIESNVLALSELEKMNKDVEFTAYDSYLNLLLGLFEKKIDVCALPASFKEMMSQEEGLEDYLDSATVIHNYEATLEVGGANLVTKDITKEPFTVLLIGIDEMRSDALILATFNPERLTVTLTSIPRDSFVPIACYKNGGSDKITHARSISRQCTLNTVEQLMGVDIDFFVEVNFYGVVEIVDALGGLFLYSPREFIGQQAGYENDENGRGKFTVWVDKGWQTMNGQQVLAFARERHNMPNGDFDREDHQREVIEAIATKMLELRDINQILEVLNAAGDNMSTNFTVNQMTQLMNLALDCMNNTTVGKADGTNIIEVQNFRLVGYSGWNYNETLELPLWIYHLYQGSLNDAKKLIQRNLQEDYEMINLNPSFHLNEVQAYSYPKYTKENYDEKRVKDILPDYMPRMYAHSGDPAYTLVEAKKWASERNIKLIVHEVRNTDEGYKEDYSHNEVIDQSVKYGRMTEKFNELEIWVIKKNLDCSLEENRQYDECDPSKILPDFTGYTESKVKNWAKEHGSIKIIYETVSYQSGYKGGTVVNQSVAAYKLLESITDDVTVYISEYPTRTLPVATLMGYTKQEIKNWFENNWDTEPEFDTKLVSNSESDANKPLEIKVNGSTVTSNNNYQTSTKVVIVMAEIGVRFPDVEGEKKENATSQIEAALSDLSSEDKARISISSLFKEGSKMGTSSDANSKIYKQSASGLMSVEDASKVELTYYKDYVEPNFDGLQGKSKSEVEGTVTGILSNYNGISFSSESTATENESENNVVYSVSRSGNTVVIKYYKYEAPVVPEIPV